MNTLENKKNEIIKEISELISKSNSSIENINSDIVNEGRVITLMCDKPWIGPRKYIEYMSEKYNCQIDINNLLGILKSKKLNNPNIRKNIAKWAKDNALYFEKALKGDRGSFIKLKVRLNSPALSGGKWLRCQEKVLLTMIAVMYPEIISSEGLYGINTLSDIRARYLLFDVIDAVSSIYMFDDKENISQISYEDAIRRIAYLESRMERTGNMLNELQNEFEEQLKVAKIKELTDFFERLNSDRYGCILDELLLTRKGIKELQKAGYIPPIEINGLFIVIKKLVQFVRDSHIEPIMRPDSIIMVKASDIEFCGYEGTPFRSSEEIKKVRVISSGWIYKDEEVQISRPKLKEEK